MDYFSELLESYTKLKKRTFKLVYLSEQEEKGMSQEVVTGGEAEAIAFLKSNIADIQKATHAAPASFTPIEGKGEIQLYMGPATSQGASAQAARRTARAAAEEGGGDEAVGGVGAEQGEMVGQQVIKARAGHTNFGTVALVNGNQVLWDPGFVAKGERFQTFVRKFLPGESVPEGERTPGEENTAAVASSEELLQQAEEAKLVPGGLFTAPENEGRFPRADEYIIIENKIIDKIKELCKEGVFRKKYGTTALGRIKLFCSNPENYIGGNYPQSLERKLVEGGGIKNPDEFPVQMYRKEGGEYAQPAGFDELDPDGTLIKDVLESQQLLVTLMGDKDISQRDCAKVNQRISTFGGDRVVIYGGKGRGEAKRGVVIKATALQKTILQHFAECGIKEATFIGTTEKHNEDKGRINEAIFQLGIELTNAFKIEDEKNREKAVKDISVKFARMIKAKKDALLNLANSSRLSEDVAIDTDSMGELQEIYGILDTLQTPDVLKKYIKDILRKNMVAISNINAAGSVPYGRSQKLGLKTDTLLYFNTPEEAEAASEKLGLSNTTVVSKTKKQIMDSLSEEDAALVSERLSQYEDNDSIPVVNVGQKVGKGTSIRLGHVAFDKPFEAGRGLAMTKGGSTPEDPAKYAARLKGDGVHSDFRITANNKEETDLHDYSRKLQEINNAASRIGKGASSVWDQNGRNITSMTAQQIAEMAAEQLFGKIPIGLLDQGSTKLGHFGTEIFDALLKTNPATGETEKVDFSDSKSRRRLQESMQRDWLSGRLHADLNNSANPQKKRMATLFVSRIAQMGVMNMEEMAQLVVKEGGETFSFDQNAIVRAISKGTRDGSISITPAKEGSYHVSFSMKGGDGKTHDVKITLGLQRSGDVAAWIANISSKDAASIGTPLSIPEKAQPENASMMYQYLKGQHQLLETLLSQTT
jgi:hypothetical protein